MTLTDEEERAIREAADAYAENNDDPDCERIERVLRGLLDRLSPITNCDCPDADNTLTQDTTSRECSEQELGKIAAN
jgi:hypothetical protein